MIKIGNCPDSWGVWFEHDEKQMDWHQYLDEVKQAGYKYTEIGPYSYMSTDPIELKSELDKRGLIAIAGTLMFDLEDNNQMPEAIEKARKTCFLLREIGAEYFIVMDGMYTDLLTGKQTLPDELTDEKFDNLCKNYIKIGKIVREYGIKLLFHPHGGTHVQTEAQIDKMISKIPKDELRFCFDTGHHIYVQDNDVYTYTEKIADQIDFMHFKDLVKTIKEQCWKEGIPYATATKKNIFAEIGKGEIDWERYAKILNKIGFDGYAVIEHDCYPADFNVPKVIQSRTGKYLESIGMGILK